MKQPNKAQKTKKVDSNSSSLRAAAEAIHKKQKRENADSKRNAKNPQSHNSQNATRRQDFGDKNGALQGESRAHTKAYVTADSPQQSPFLAQKPTPETQKAQSSSPKQTTSTDILTCLANLSSDEVFTPPHIVNAMLDLLPQELFSDPASTFLDPACKSGVFLREIARRLMLGLEPHFPEPSKRIAHILTHQLYGIAITELTALLSRRTLYGSKDVHNPRYSIPQKSGAALPQGGNIYYAPTPHSFKNAKCTYCGASQSQYDRDSTLESHAYAFIHELEPLEEFFASVKAPSPSSQADTAHSPSLRDLRQQGVAIHKSTQVDSKAVNSASAESMDCHADKSARNDKQSHPQGVPVSFSVIIGNPPYQLSDGSGGSDDAAIPIYNKFIDRARELNPKHIVIICPSRWMIGGRGLDKFRQSMIEDTRIKYIVDYENAKTCFPDNHIDGGVCYFHWDRDYKGKSNYKFIANNGDVIESKRFLANNMFDFVIRDSRALSILNKISSDESFSTIVSKQKPYGVRSFLFNEPELYGELNLQDTPFLHSVKIYGVKGRKGGAKRVSGYVRRDSINIGLDSIDKYNIFFSKAYSTNTFHYPEPILAKPNEICTETFLRIGSFATKQEQINCYSYMQTKFFKVLLYLGKGSMNVSQEVFKLIPLQDFSQQWSDELLYKKYGLSDDEIAYIESRIKGI